MSEPEVPDEAYIAAAIADRGLEVVRGVGSYDAEVRFRQPHAGYNSHGGVGVLTARARDFMPKDEAMYEHNRPEPADHPAPAALSAADPGDAEAKLKPRKKQNRPKG